MQKKREEEQGLKANGLGDSESSSLDDVLGFDADGPTGNVVMDVALQAEESLLSRGDSDIAAEGPLVKS